MKTTKDELPRWRDTTIIWGIQAALHFSGSCVVACDDHGHALLA